MKKIETVLFKDLSEIEYNLLVDNSENQVCLLDIKDRYIKFNLHREIEVLSY